MYIFAVFINMAHGWGYHQVITTIFYNLPFFVSGNLISVLTMYGNLFCPCPVSSSPTNSTIHEMSGDLCAWGNTIKQRGVCTLAPIVYVSRGTHVKIGAGK